MDIKELLTQYRISDYLISKGYSLKRAGNKWKCLCPFHAEKTPSFWITTMPDGMDVYKCFGCSCSGSIISLIEHVENQDKKTVVKKLAENLNIKLDSYTHIDRIEPLKSDVLEFFCQEDEMVLELADFIVPFLKRNATKDVINKISRVYEKIDKLTEVGDTEGIQETILGILKITEKYVGEKS